MMKRLFASFCALMMLVSSSAFAASDSPVETIRDGARQVLDLLKQDNGKNTRQIRQQVEAVAVPQFDFQRMTALAVGRGWRQASPEQQQQLSQEFQTLLVRIYTSTMTRYKGTQVDVKPNPILASNGREATVKSEVTLPNSSDKKPVSIDYTLYKTSQGWKIYNVSVEGASLVTVYRNQFNDEINKNGVDGLIKLLKDKNAGVTAKGNA
ncbi:ABC transporter substrate-binding protein [Crenobacter sp. SG2305]|uniref:MlaC/ttg2D family ABC transporter substrate-binding protein n=1 Tax=Crenobacter oryzisoli TaxID=3056844 RepID=UPI0025AAE054|nr:ABC transporter substrate-binding protein [Crenobacter sp. SG2305]MDN0085024.1 ABC transporter substrate-binding protein [Crenobacter sp. SG2305]